MNVRFLVVGLGVQGAKRARVAGVSCIGSVDPVAPGATYRELADVPLGSFDAAFLCVPDAAKMPLLRRLLAAGKHVLVEKPLPVETSDVAAELAELARLTGSVCITGYNHRFEPAVMRLRDVIASGRFGRLYRARLFYGNGTARRVRDSVWRDSGSGVLADLGSHLLDLARFLFDEAAGDFALVSADRFENRSCDHAVFVSRRGPMRIECEATLIAWRNHFTLDLFAEKGSAHIESLCKWGPSRLTLRTRILPSGQPLEDVENFPEGDPTWALEHAHFQSLCAAAAAADFQHDLWIGRTLAELAVQDAT